MGQTALPPSSTQCPQGQREGVPGNGDGPSYVATTQRCICETVGG